MPVGVRVCIHDRYIKCVCAYIIYIHQKIQSIAFLGPKSLAVNVTVCGTVIGWRAGRAHECVDIDTHKEFATHTFKQNMYPTNIYTQHTCVLKSCPSTQSGQYVGLVLGTPASAHSASPATHTFRHVTPVSTHSESCDTQEIEAPYASFCVQSSHVT